MIENKRFRVENYKDFTVITLRLYDAENEDKFYDWLTDLELIVDLLNELTEEKEYYQIKSGKCEEELLKLRRDNKQLKEENNELKEEVQLLKEGMKSYENAIPYVCTCGQVNGIRSEMFDFRIKQNKFYKEHPNRCIIVIDGVRYE